MLSEPGFSIIVGAYAVLTTIAGTQINQVVKEMYIELRNQVGEGKGSMDLGCTHYNSRYPYQPGGKWDVYWIKELGGRG